MRSAMDKASGSQEKSALGSSAGRSSDVESITSVVSALRERYLFPLHLHNAASLVAIVVHNAASLVAIVVLERCLLLPV